MAPSYIFLLGIEEVYLPKYYLDKYHASFAVSNYMLQIMRFICFIHVHSIIINTNLTLLILRFLVISNLFSTPVWYSVLLKMAGIQNEVVSPPFVVV